MSGSLNESLRASTSSKSLVKGNRIVDKESIGLIESLQGSMDIFLLFYVLIIATFARNEICCSQNFSLVAVGDISFDGPIRYFGDRSCGYSRPFDNVQHMIKDADFAIANFESPVVFPNMTKFPLVPEKEIHLGAWPSSVQGLRYAGFGAVGLSNNHLLDFGDSSVNLTTDTLTKTGIPCFGVTYGDTSYSQQVPVVKTINGIRVAFLAYCANAEGCYRVRSLGHAGPALYEFDVVAKDVYSLKANNSDTIIVVYFHWGTEYRLIPSEAIVHICERVKSLGVNVILGSHQHVVQGHVFKDNVLTVYSLGNFLFHRNDIYKFMFYHNHKIDPEKLKEYEATLNQVTSATQRSRIFKINLTRNGVISAIYQDLIIIANNTDHCIQPTPVSQQWITVCDSKDKNCLN